MTATPLRVEDAGAAKSGAVAVQLGAPVEPPVGSTPVVDALEVLAEPVEPALVASLSVSEGPPEVPQAIIHAHKIRGAPRSMRRG